jgi:hypothetical protein
VLVLLLLLLLLLLPAFPLPLLRCRSISRCVRCSLLVLLVAAAFRSAAPGAGLLSLLLRLAVLRFTGNRSDRRWP